MIKFSKCKDLAVKSHKIVNGYNLELKLSGSTNGVFSGAIKSTF